MKNIYIYIFKKLFGLFKYIINHQVCKNKYTYIQTSGSLNSISYLVYNFLHYLCLKLEFQQSEHFITLLILININKAITTIKV